MHVKHYNMCKGAYKSEPRITFNAWTVNIYRMVGIIFRAMHESS
jgi:hypothetical protein